ncbi:serine hydrolase domain-containing protein [Dactylosporangium sp. NPDC005572]|uniref:serine hydrolase domain-containing protein n=1 Tax=Dactylosporangium sp. NPDC005572 TaxID=3156889 RepID=UPI0033A960A1
MLVTEAFERNFTEHGEVGAAFAAYHHGRLVVDLWGGVTDPATGAPWRADTLQLIFSGAKGLTTACVLLLAERGQLDLDAPAARYWPEFAAAGKGAITVAGILSHQARLPGVREPVPDLLDHRAVAALLAAQAPLDDPRAGFVYHALTWGWLVDELIRRVDGRTAGALFADEFAGPLGLDVYLGLPDEHHHRASTMLAGPGLLLDPEPTGTDPLRVLTHNPLVVTGSPAVWNSPRFRRAGLAAVGAFATARSMARFYACLAAGGELDGVRVLAPSTVDRGRRLLRRGTSPVWGTPMAFGAGFELNTPLEILGPPPDAFGHAGAGGSRHGAWPSLGVAFSYAMNEARAASPDPRPRALLEALHAAVTYAEGRG